MKNGFIVILALAVAGTAAAATPESANFRISDFTFNAGGHPADGVVLASTDFRLSLDALGDGLVGPDMAGDSHSGSSGFAVCYPPPGEVLGLRFTDPLTLIWGAERSAGAYNLYRGLLAGVDGSDYGSCRQQGLSPNTTVDAAPPPDGEGYFYLLTAENRLGEEGTLGPQGSGAERPNLTPCP